MEVKAQLNQLRMAPRKVRLVANLIKGLHVEDARVQLELMTKKSSDPMLKLLNSAVANAKNNHKLDESTLFVSKVLVNGGPTIKRWFPRAMGRAFPIKKRTCSIVLVLSELEGEKPKKNRKVKPEKTKNAAHKKSQEKKVSAAAEKKHHHETKAEQENGHEKKTKKSAEAKNEKK